MVAKQTNTCIDGALEFDMEREINGIGAAKRLLVRREKSLPLLVELETWLREQRNKLSCSSNVLKPINIC